MLLQGLYKAFNCFLQGFYKAFARPSQAVYNVCVTRFLRGVYKSACSVAAAYKPPMLVPRVRLPAGAPHVISPWTAASNTVFRKAFTLFLHSFYNVCSRGFHNVFCEGFTRLSQCFIMLSQGFDKVFTTFSLGFSQCFLQGSQKVFTMPRHQALRRLLKNVWRAPFKHPCETPCEHLLNTMLNML